MNGIEIETTNDKVIISIKRTELNNEFIISSLRWFGIETAISDLNFDESLLSEIDVLKNNIWDKRKSRVGL
jgi:hypothetical protein